MRRDFYVPRLLGARGKKLFFKKFFKNFFFQKKVFFSRKRFFFTKTSFFPKKSFFSKKAFFSTFKLALKSRDRRHLAADRYECKTSKQFFKMKYQ